MRRERALKVVLVLLGLLFSAAAGCPPLMMMVKQDPALAMMMSLYLACGQFVYQSIHEPRSSGF